MPEPRAGHDPLLGASVSAPWTNTPIAAPHQQLKGSTARDRRLGRDRAPCWSRSERSAIAMRTPAAEGRDSNQAATSSAEEQRMRCSGQGPGAARLRQSERHGARRARAREGDRGSRRHRGTRSCALRGPRYWVASSFAACRAYVAAYLRCRDRDPHSQASVRPTVSLNAPDVAGPDGEHSRDVGRVRAARERLRSQELRMDSPSSAGERELIGARTRS